MIRWAFYLLLAAALVFGVVYAARWLTGTVDPGGVKRTEARVDVSRADAAIESGADAANTVDAVEERTAAGKALDVQNSKEIDNAQGATDKVPDEVRAALRRSLCRRPEHRDNPKCLDR